jgi:sulfopyruvate decarboxylase TPP-binding subunit
VTADLGQSLVDVLDALPIRPIVTVPGSGLDVLYARYADSHSCLFASREEEAIGIAAGLVLAGARPLVLMQQAGVGNALNAVITLADAYGLAFPIVVCSRGPEDPNPVQRLSSVQTARILGVLEAIRVCLPDERDAQIARRAIMAPVRWIICERRDDGSIAAPRSPGVSEAGVRRC